MKIRNLPTQRGFTLVELLITVVILGILAAVAIPQYRESVKRSNRAVAKAALADLIAREESFFTERRAYTTSLTDLGANNFLNRDGKFTATSGADSIYSMDIGFTTTTASQSTCPSAGGTASTRVWVRAVPVSPGPQASDRCATLCLSSAGEKLSSTTNADCWNR